MSDDDRSSPPPLEDLSLSPEDASETGDSAVASVSASEQKATSSDSESLGELFITSQRLHEQVQNLSLPVAEREEIAKRASDTLTKLYRLVKAASLFSSNEELDDINTNDLKYILAPFYLGEVMMSLNDPSKRAATIQVASVYFTKFLQQCEQLKLMQKDEVAALKRGPSVAVDPTTGRNEKIARFKREQELKEKLNVLAERIKKQAKEQSKRAGGGSRYNDRYEEEDEATRDHTILTIQAAVGASLNHIKYIHDELNILKQQAAFEKQRAQRAAQGQSAVANAAPAPTVFRIPAPGAAPVRLYPGQSPSVADRIAMRADSRNQVFRDPNPATLTVEEWAMIQEAKGLMPPPMDVASQVKALDQQQRDREDGILRDSGATDIQNEEEDDSEAAVDKRTLEAREWDNWKDVNPRGAGNTKFK